MLNKSCFLTFALALFLPLHLMAEPADPAPAAGKMKLFAAGGGGLSDEVLNAFVSLSPVDVPHLLIIPHAARNENLERSGQTNTKRFERVGLSQITVLDLKDPAAAREAIARSDLIWMSGGHQRRLASTLKDAGVAEAIRQKAAEGTPVGGSSAGAAILSEIMIAGGRRNAETGLLDPVISDGLGLWPDAIVDQHFSERNRISRLQSAIKTHPGHVGLGIDEETAVAFDGSKLRVIGKGNVTVIRAANPNAPDPVLQSLRLQPGETYDLNPKTADSPVAIAVHGGAGALASLSAERRTEYEAKLEEALRAGHAILREGGSSIDAVEAAVRILEDSPLFNAGHGAVLTNEGTAELDASIMDGRTLQAGAVASVKRIRNPISLARKVMEKSPHVLLVGDGAEVFAKEQGAELVPNEYFKTEYRINQWRRVRDREAAKANQEEASLALPLSYSYGTVGAVALDRAGNLAAATSTGGMTFKKFGRVGDSPIIGAGTFADNETCAVSSTGHGEYFIRGAIASDIAAVMRYTGASLQEAAESRIHEKLTQMGGTGGVIAMDTKGNVAMPFNTVGMYRGLIDTDGNLRVAIYADTEEAAATSDD